MGRSSGAAGTEQEELEEKKGVGKKEQEELEEKKGVGKKEQEQVQGEEQAHMPKPVYNFFFRYS